MTFRTELRDQSVQSLALPGHREQVITVPAPVRRTPLAKVIFDKLFSLAALLALAPLLISIWLIIRLSGGGSPIFAHDRIGRGGRTFRCLKFRTMFEDADARLEHILATDPVAAREWRETRKLTHDPRISAIGRILRKTSLDELPQFWNVLTGDMSVVGPRPIVMEERHHYGASFADYIAVRPGLTGPWQVGGRSNTSYEYRVAQDVDYVRRWSFWRDLRIVWRTVFVILVQDGAR